MDRDWGYSRERRVEKAFYRVPKRIDHSKASYLQVNASSLCDHFDRSGGLEGGLEMELDDVLRSIIEDKRAGRKLYFKAHKILDTTSKGDIFYAVKHNREFIYGTIGIRKGQETSYKHTNYRGSKEEVLSALEGYMRDQENRARSPILICNVNFARTPEVDPFLGRHQVLKNKGRTSKRKPKRPRVERRVIRPSYKQTG